MIKRMKRFPSGTNHSTVGSRRANRMVPSIRVRLLGFALVVLLGVLLISWIKSNAWRQVDSLQKEYAAVKGQNFSVGMILRDAVHGLNDILLDRRLTNQARGREQFHREADQWQAWIVTHRSALRELADLRLFKKSKITEQMDLFVQAETAFEQYLAQTTSLLEPSPSVESPASFTTAYQTVHQASKPVLDLCDQLVAAQHQAFDQFLDGTQRALIELQKLLKLSLALILALVVVVAFLIYRGMIAPLREKLSESEAIIERQEKLASLGTLAAGVAHEIRNPLTAIKFRLFSLKQASPAFAHNEDAQVISSEINRLDRIVKDFLQFARPSEPEFVRVPAERLLQDVGELLRSELEKAAIELRLEAPGTTWVRVDTQQLKQILINLIQNAADSIGQKGTITLRANRETAEFDQGIRPAVVLQIADTGPGIPPEVEKRLFDPFFSTKEGGTGLGLSIAARNVEKNGGRLRYQTELNRGTIFEIVLPWIEDNAT